MQSQRFVLRMTAATTADGTRKKQRYQNLIGQKYVCKAVAPLAAKKTGAYAPALPFSVLLCGKIPHVTSPPFGRDTMRQALLRRFFLPTPAHPLFRLPFCKRRARCCPWQTFLFRPLSHHLSRREVIYGNDVPAHFGKRCAETNHRRRIQPFKHGIVAAHKSRSASFAAYHAYCHDGMLLHPVKTKFVGGSKSPAYCGINNKPV